ncbi:MAG: hypothetical protein Fur0010_23440 [Bdellovibrio sp.]
MKCAGKKVLITGCNRGMGRGFALEAEKRGAHLILHARKWTEESKKGFLYPERHDFIDADLSKSDDLEKLIHASHDVDILINNAGVLTGDLIENQSFEEIEMVMNINSLVPMKLCQALIPSMLKKSQALIVNNTSVSAIMRFPLASTYAASKSALAAFSECLSNELDGTPIKVLVLYTPGIATDMFTDVCKRYGKNLDMGLMTSIPIEKYASRVLDAIENGKTVLNPSGSSAVGLFLARYIPWLFNFFIKKMYKRSLK